MKICEHLQSNQIQTSTRKMWKNILSVLIIFINLQVFLAQSIKSGQCPPIYSVANFNIYKFAGTWYEIAAIPIKGVKFDKCVIANYVVDSSNVLRISINYFDGKQVQQMNNAFTITNSSGVWSVNIPMIKSNIEFGILDTDYINYGVTYGCAKLLNYKIEIAWIVSRQPTLSKDLYNRAVAALKNQKISSKQLKSVRQTNCPRLY